MRYRHPAYLAMFETAMQFLRGNSYGTMYLAPVEMELWQELHPGEPW
jgi:hypothetical protein